VNLVFRLAITLGLITSVAGFGLGLVYTVTKDRIAKAESAKTVHGLSVVLPGYEVDVNESKKVDGIEYWVGHKPDGSVGYAFIAKKNGYSSEIQTLVGIDPEGEILGISVLFQQETPGLGARVQEVASNVYLWQWITGRLPEDTGPKTPWFADQFVGLQAEDIEIHKGKEWQAMSEQEKQQMLEQNAVSALSGATISTKAITDSIEGTAAKVLAAVNNEQSAQLLRSESNV